MSIDPDNIASSAAHRASLRNTDPIDSASIPGALPPSSHKGSPSGTSDPIATTPSSPNAATALGAGTAASIFGLDGAGVKIGIISDSFDALGGASVDEASGALPPAAKVHVLQDDPGGRDEGRAMAEIVHSVAPGAQIYFYSSQHSSANFAAGVAALQAAGCSVICDDVTCPKEPFFQTGDPIEKAIGSFTDAGGSYFTDASNAGPKSAFAASWAGMTATLPGIGPVETLNVGTAAAPNAFETMHLAASVSTSLDLQWAQPWASIDGTGSAFSLGLAIYDPSGKLVADIADDDVGGDPVQSVDFTPEQTGNYTVAIYRNGGAAPSGPVKLVGNNNSGDGVAFADATGTGSIFGHNADPHAITVGAVRLTDTPAYGGTLASEPFSAAGAGPLLFDSTGAPLPFPLATSKPDISGPDGQTTTLPASDLDPFLGTSAATPAVAALGALMTQADPALDAGEIKAILKATATAFGTASQAGAGFAQAPGALALAEASNTTVRDDFFGGGSSDILWQDDDGAAAITNLQQQGVTGTSALATPGAGWTATGTGDFEGTGGHTDILWQNRNGALAISDIVDGAVASHETVAADPGSAWSVVQTADFNDDGQSDILFQDRQGDLKIWTMDGDEVASSTDLGSSGAGWTAQDVGDFNGDGKSDILFQNQDGALAIWTMNGSSVAAKTILSATPGAGWQVAGVGDFDDVGEAEILLRGSDGELSVWGTNGSAVTSRQMLDVNPGADWIVAGVGTFKDSGGDGILLQDTSTGFVEICTPHGNGHATMSQPFAAPGSSWKAIVH